jgi:hypothetical protein
VLRVVTMSNMALREASSTWAAPGEALGLRTPATALDGLFTMLAEEERAIRKDPLGQASKLLQNVFGALKN